MRGHRTDRFCAYRARAWVRPALALGGFLAFALSAPTSGAAVGRVGAPRASGQTAPAAIPAGQESSKQLVVPGTSNWTDTGIDVEQNDEFLITASGGISLQRGNPTAYCGPDGYNMLTAQQPLPEKNIGALVGRVVRLISVTRDPETKKEIRDELVEVFFVGTESRVLMPISGRLFLGPNENVVGDNSGAFKVSITRLKKPDSRGSE